MKKFVKEELTLEEGLKKEWIITNRNWWICFINSYWMQYKKIPWIISCTICSTRKKKTNSC